MHTHTHIHTETRVKFSVGVYRGHLWCFIETNAEIVWINCINVELTYEWFEIECEKNHLRLYQIVSSIKNRFFFAHGKKKDKWFMLNFNIFLHIFVYVVWVSLNSIKKQHQCNPISHAKRMNERRIHFPILYALDKQCM